MGFFGTPAPLSQRAKLVLITRPLGTNQHYRASKILARENKQRKKREKMPKAQGYMYGYGLFWKIVPHSLGSSGRQSVIFLHRMCDKTLMVIELPDLNHLTVGGWWQ